MTVKKTPQEIKENSDQLFQNYKKELHRVRAFQSQNSIVIETIGGLSFNFGNKFSASGNKIAEPKPR